MLITVDFAAIVSKLIKKIPSFIFALVGHVEQTAPPNERSIIGVNKRN